MMTNTAIPFLDLVSPHVELEEELVSVFRDCIETASFIGGPIVEHFENEFANFCDAKFCIGVGSGTDAVRFALMAAGVRTGESVITVPNTFIATTEAISQAGAVPEFVDVDEGTSNMDPQKLREYLERNCDVDQQSKRPVSRRTGRIISAVVPVHLYGQMADMDRILEIAEAYRLIVIEDACQAHGAKYFSRKEQRWMTAGSMGNAAAFSFYPGKNLGACGEAGAVTTNDEQIARTIRIIRDHGQRQKYHHDMEGYNGRLDTIQAGLLQVKLRHLAKWNAQRREHAAEYDRLLTAVDCGINPPHEPSWSKAVYHLYVIRTNDREGMMNHLKKAGIATGIHYPTPLHLQKAYSSLNYQLGDFPVSEKLAAEIVSLPMFPQLSAEQQTRVVEEIVQFMNLTTPVSQVSRELVTADRTA
jgi:dTDP-4-amino-4,6-dideoxygalactose transaminase